MMDRLHYRLERSGKTATLYLAGTVSVEDALTLCDACADLPMSVRTLRLDFRAIGSMSAAAIAVVRTLLRHWRAHRGDELQLSTSHLVATFSHVERCVTPQDGWGWPGGVAPHERAQRASVGAYRNVLRAGTSHRTPDCLRSPCPR
jgi:ABC-type transporter Mla MlaB component